MTEREECRHFRGALAMRALGRVDELDAALDDHLARCPECRAELDDLRTAADAVLLADPATPHDTSRPPLDLPQRILAQVNAESARRRWRRTGAIAAAVVFVVAGAGFMVARFGGGSSQHDTARIDLLGTADTSGTATLIAHAWGTEVALDVDGLSDGEVYWLWLTGDDGDRVGAGTFTGTGGEMHAVLASALPAEDARRIWLTDEADAIVLDAMIPPPG